MRPVYLRVFHPRNGHFAECVGWIQVGTESPRKILLGSHRTSHEAAIALIQYAVKHATAVPSIFFCPTRCAVTAYAQENSLFGPPPVEWRSLEELKNQSPLFADDFFYQEQHAH